MPPALLQPLFGFLFSTPLTALAVAVGAASLPIIIHLLNRKRFRVVTWAAMRFLLAAQKKNTRKMRLEQLLLLALRTLLVLLMVLAMASVMPWSEDLWTRLFPEGAQLIADGGRRTHKIIVIDGSFSMATKVGERSFFDRARSLAHQMLSESKSGDGFSVLLMAAPPRRIVPEPSEDTHKVAEEIQAVRLPHGNADVSGMLNAVDDMLRRSPAKYEVREVYFLTDLQRSTWTARQTGDPAEVLRRIQARARTIFVDVGQPGVQNSAVTNLVLGVPFVTTGMTTPLVVTLHNYGSAPRKQARVELYIGKSREAAGDPPFAMRLADQRSIDLPNGETAVNFSYKFTAPGDYLVQVKLDNDALDLDDSRAVVVTVKETVPVMLVNGKTAPEPYDRGAEWLRDALNPFPPGQSPRYVAARPKIVSEAQFADAVLGDLTPFDCVFLCDVARLGAGEIRRLETHLRKGGGVVFCLGPQVDLESYNRLIYRNGEGILPARLLAQQQAPEKRFFNLFADEKAFHEPPLDAFAGERDRISLLSARFQQYVRSELNPRSRARKVLSFMPETSPSAAASDRASAKPLPMGDPALIEWTRYRGRALLFTSTVNMDWTAWPISPSYPSFVQEVLHFAVAGRLREQASGVGEVLEEYPQAASAGLEVAVRLPDGRIEQSHTETREEIPLLRWTETDQSGIYRATIGQHPQEYLFAVNVPTATESRQACESDLARTNESELQTQYPNWEFQVVTELNQVNHSGGPAIEYSSERPRRGMGMLIARWLLRIMLILIVLEVVLAWRFGHYTAVAQGSERPPAPGRVLPGVIAVVAGVLFVVLATVLTHAAWTGDFLGFLPENTRSEIEAGLGIPPPAAGEGTRWHLEFTPYFWDAAADPWLACAFALAMGILVVAIYLREGQTASALYKILLAGLRMFFILLTLAVLLPQLRLWFEREGWPDVAIIVDDSQSMGTTDRYQDARVQAVADRLAQVGTLATPDRLHLAQALLTSNKQEWLETLLTRRRVKLHLYHVSSRAARLADASEAPQLAALARAIRELKPEGESSQLGTAVRQVLNDFRGSSLAAIIMLTDGVTTEGEDLVRVARYSSQMGVPLLFVGIGDEHDVRDLRLHDLQVDDSVYVNDQLVFEGRLTGQGYSDGRIVPVRLFEKSADGKFKELDKVDVATDPQGKPVKFRLKHQPAEPGEKTFVIQVPKQPDEAESGSNNQMERNVFVRETKLIKVLYVEGYARYEYRFVKNLLERESDRDKRNKTIDLKVLLLDADPEYATEDKSALADFPTREELNNYDVILFGDVDPKDSKIGEKNLQSLAEFVKERGGGFLMIAGQRYSPHAYKDSPLRDILPVDVTTPLQPEGEYATSYRPELTAVGRFHPIFRFSPDETDNRLVWSQLSELFWWSEGYRIKPAAEVLMVHTKQPAGGPPRAGSSGESGYPLLVQQFVGAGRSMFFGFDETWRWRFREHELRFNQFWIQTVRYLARSRLGRIDLHVDRQSSYRRGEPIKVTVRFPDDAPPPGPETKVAVIVTHTSSKPGMGTDKATVPLTKLDGSRATYEGLITQTPDGEYHFLLGTPIVPDPKPRAEARVLPPPGEMEQLRMNQPDMERAAEETHGKFYTLSDADRLVDELPSGTRIALNTPQPPRLLWNHYATFALALGLLGTEWVLRKRKHLL